MVALSSSMWGLVAAWVALPVGGAIALALVTKRNAARKPVRRVCVVEVDPTAGAVAVDRSIEAARRVARDAVLLVVMSGEQEPDATVAAALERLFSDRDEHAMALVASERARTALRLSGLPLFASREEAAEWLVSA